MKILAPNKLYCFQETSSFITIWLKRTIFGSCGTALVEPRGFPAIVLAKALNDERELIFIFVTQSMTQGNWPSIPFSIDWATVKMRFSAGWSQILSCNFRVINGGYYKKNFGICTNYQPRNTTFRPKWLDIRSEKRGFFFTSKWSSHTTDWINSSSWKAPSNRIRWTEWSNKVGHSQGDQLLTWINFVLILSSKGFSNSHTFQKTNEW